MFPSPVYESRGQVVSKTLLYFYLISEEDKREDNEDPDIAKIKKVQSFFRGWLCRYVGGKRGLSNQIGKTPNVNVLPGDDGNRSWRIT